MFSELRIKWINDWQFMLHSMSDISNSCDIWDCRSADYQYYLWSMMQCCATISEEPATTIIRLYDWMHTPTMLMQPAHSSEMVVHIYYGTYILHRIICQKTVMCIISCCKSFILIISGYYNLILHGRERTVSPDTCCAN